MSDPLARAVRTGVVLTSGIGLAAGVVSYDHALYVAHLAGMTGRLAYIVPLFADGLIALSSAAMYAASQAKVARPGWATAGLVIGVAVTVCMNVAAGAAHGPVGALVAAMPPAVFIISLEILMWLFRLGRQVALLPAGDSVPQCPHGVPGSVGEAVRLDFEHRRDCLGQKPTYVELGARWGVDRRSLPKLVGAGLNGDGHG